MYLKRSDFPTKKAFEEYKAIFKMHTQLQKSVKHKPKRKLTRLK